MKSEDRLPLFNRKPQLSPGDTAPDFELAGSDGRTYRLRDYAGRTAVVVAWFPKAFTGGWTAECTSLRESGEALRGTGVAYFAASTDDAETNTRFAEKLGLDFPILSDPTKQTARAYGVLGMAGMASRATVYIGADGRILEIDRQVSPRTHGTDVVATVKRLGIART